MSIVFKPKIPERFKGEVQKKRVVIKPVVPLRLIKNSWISDEVAVKSKSRKSPQWSPRDINLLVDLRAMQVPIYDCSRILRRSEASTRACIHAYDLYSGIKRQKLINIKRLLDD